jgi:hypothetical protein
VTLLFNLVSPEDTSFPTVKRLPEPSSTYQVAVTLLVTSRLVMTILFYFLRPKEPSFQNIERLPKQG